MLGAAITRRDDHGTSGLVIGAGSTGNATLVRRVKRHIGGDVGHRLAARTGCGHVQLGAGSIAVDLSVYVKDAAQDGQVTQDGLIGLDVQDPLVDVGRSGGIDFAREIDRTWSRLREDARSLTISNVRGEGQDAGPIDMRHEIGVRRRVALNAAAGDRESVVALEDEATCGQRKRITCADVQDLPGPARLDLHLVRRPVTANVEGLRDPGCQRIRPARRTWIKGVIGKGGARRRGASVLDEVDISVAEREDDLTARGAAGNRSISSPQPKHRVGGRGHEQGHAGGSGRDRTQRHHGDVRRSPIRIDGQEVGAGAAGETSECLIQYDSGIGFPDHARTIQRQCSSRRVHAGERRSRVIEKNRATVDDESAGRVVRAGSAIQGQYAGTFLSQAQGANGAVGDGTAEGGVGIVQADIHVRSRARMGVIQGTSAAQGGEILVGAVRRERGTSLDLHRREPRGR